MTPGPESLARKIAAVTHGEATSDGDGVKMTRLIGSRAQPPLDPFLMLDFFGSEAASDYLGGFPDHPHRGFETVTYMLAGRMRHWDNHGHSGVIAAGDVQWMKAGRGLIHSEMPEQDSRPHAGVPAVDQPPRFRKNDRSGLSGIFRDADSDGRARRLPRENHRRDEQRRRHRAGPRAACRCGLFRHRSLRRAGVFVEPLPPDHEAFFVLYEGEATAPSGSGAEKLEALSLVALGSGETAMLTGGRKGRPRSAAGRASAARTHRLERPFRHEHARRTHAGV